MSAIITTILNYIKAITQYTDNFQAYTVGSLGGQGLWEPGLNSVAVEDVTGNKMAAPGRTLNTDSCVFVNQAFSNNQWAQIVIKKGLANCIGVALRCNNGQYYAAYASPTAVYVGRVMASTWVDLDHASTTINDNDVLYMSVIGTTLKILVNGSPISTLGNVSGEITDANISSGAIGISAWYDNNTTSNRGEDFSGGSL